VRRRLRRMPEFDVVVVGGGPSGEEASGRLTDHGLSVALVEDRLVGGECVHWACMPSKALLRPYEALAEARRIPGAREAANGGLDVSAVLRRRDEIIGAPDDSALLPWVESHGITLIRGHGRIVGERRVLVGDDELEARKAVVLSVGSQPLVPAFQGLDELAPGQVWTNREATTTHEIPGRIVVVGGGPEGAELAQAFQTLGSSITLIEAQQRVLPHAEEFASAQVTAALREFGVDVLTGHSVVNFSRNGGGVAAKTSAGKTVFGDVVLIAVGRKPTSEDLGIEIVGLEPGSLVEVDAHMRVPTAPWLYAVGDINGRALFTHMGRYQARLAVDHILGHEHAASHGADGAQSPHVTFTDPQVASVGHTTETATRAGIEFDVYDTETSGTALPNVGGFYYAPNAPGTARFVVDRRRRILIGCTITGSEVVDFVHAATIAVVGEIPLERLRHAVPPFPTRSELWLSLLEQAGV
jgi:pyruvate/2-oxoglutarate dehydrogenase complex dihydrolipoamide dehydrogenase (E3) component